MILIISSPRDAHLPFVTKYLREKYAVIDPGTILEGRSLTYDLRDDRLRITYEGKPLDHVKSVWYRKPRHVRHDLEFNVDEKYLGYAQNALRSHFEQLQVLFPEAVWISDPYAVERSSNKVMQLDVARQLGFKVPETIFTSDPASAEQFIHSHPETIVKSLSSQWPQPDMKARKRLAFVSKVVTPATEVSYQGLNLAPAIFQEAIKPLFDLRVAVVGDQVFATKVTLKDSNAPEAVRDWRIGHAKNMGELVFEPYDLPKKISEQCITLVQRLGLLYGAIDFVHDPQGRIWFLEINPNGQWAFVDEHTTDNIGQAIANLLNTKN